MLLVALGIIAMFVCIVLVLELRASVPKSSYPGLPPAGDGCLKPQLETPDPAPRLWYRRLQAQKPGNPDDAIDYVDNFFKDLGINPDEWGPSTKS